MAVRFRIDQVGRGQGAVDQSRFDLTTSALITLTAIEPAPGSGITYEWEIVDRAGNGSASSSLSATTGNSVTLTPPPYYLYAFLVELRAFQDGALVGKRRRALGTRSSKFGLRLPLFSETADPSAKQSARNVEASTDNSTYLNLGGTNEIASNWRGWTQLIHDLVMALEGLQFGVDNGTMPSATGHDVGDPGDSTLGSPIDHVHPNPPIASIPLPRRTAWTSYRGGSHFFAMADHEHEGAGFFIKTIEGAGPFNFTLGSYGLGGNAEYCNALLDFRMSGATTISLPGIGHGDLLNVPTGARIWGMQGGDGLIVFQALTNARITSTTGLQTTGKGCLYLLINRGIIAGAVDWSLTIFHGTGEGGGGGTVDEATIRQLISTATDVFYYNNKPIRLLGDPPSPPHDQDAVNLRTMHNYVAGIYAAAGADLTGRLVDQVRVTGLQGYPLSNVAPAAGQILQWNDTTDRWEPTTMTGGEGGGALPPIPWNSSLEGTYPNIELKSIVNVPVTDEVHSQSNGMVLTIDDDFKWRALPLPQMSGDFEPGSGGYRVIALWERPILSTAPLEGQALVWNGSAWAPLNLGGDVDGSLGENHVTAIRGVYVDYNPPTNGQVLAFNGTWWTPTTIGSAIAGGGDVSGQIGSLTVEKLQGRPVSSNAPSSGQALVWNGSAWAPTAVSSGTPTLSGDVTGASNSTTVGGLQGRTVAATAPSNGDVLTWTGSAWTPVAGGGGGSSNATQLQGYAVSDFEPFAGSYLMWSGSDWGADNLRIAGYQVLGTPANGQVLTFVETGDENPNHWEPQDSSGGGGGGNATSLQGVPVWDGTPEDGRVLVFSQDDNMWGPGEVPGIVGWELRAALDFRHGHTWTSGPVSAGSNITSFNTEFIDFSVHGAGTAELIENRGLVLTPSDAANTEWDGTAVDGLALRMDSTSIEPSTDMMVYIRVAGIGADGTEPFAPGDWVGVTVGFPDIDSENTQTLDSTFRLNQVSAQCGMTSTDMELRLVMGLPTAFALADSSLTSPGSVLFGAHLNGLSEAHVARQSYYEGAQGVEAPYGDTGNEVIHATRGSAVWGGRNRFVFLHAASSRGGTMHTAGVAITHLWVLQRRPWPSPQLPPIPGPTGGGGGEPNVVTMTVYLNNMSDEAAVRAAIESHYAGLTMGQGCYQSEIADIVMGIGSGGFVSGVSPEEPTDSEATLTLGTITFEPSGEGGA